MASPRCYIETLPAELLCPILSYLPDLEALDDLIRASPAAFRAFGDEAVSALIFEAILTSGATHKYACALIRMVTLIRADAFPATVTDFTTFKTLIVHETTPNTYKPPYSQWEHDPIRLPKNIAPSILRGVLATNRKIQRLTFGCLDFYLARFLQLKPYHPAGFFCDGKPWAGDEEFGDFLGPWKEKVDNVKFYYPVQSIGPPSWLEQLRVYRQFWRRQLSHDLKAVIQDSNRATWPVFDEIEEEEKEPTEEEMRVCREWELSMGFSIDEDEEEEEEEPEEEPEESPEERDQRLLRHRLRQITPEMLVSVPNYSVQHWAAGEELRHRATKLEEELLQTVSQYTCEMSEIISEERYLALKTEYLKGPASGGIDSVDHSSSNYTLSSSVSSDDRYDSSVTPLQHVDFAAFRRLGFAIWNDERMIAYGLLPPTWDYCVGMLRSCMEAWRSLLTEEERDVVDKENARRYGHLVH